MPTTHASDSDWDDEFVDADDGGGDEEEPTEECPYCGREIHEDAPRCPYCGRYVSSEDAPPRPKPWWLVLGVAVCLYVVYRWIRG